MCGNCREPTCGNTCIEKLEKSLKSLSDFLKENYNSARGDIFLEFDSLSRKLKSRENELARELEVKFNKRIFSIER